MRKIISVVLSFGLLFQQSGLVYAVSELNLANYLSQARSAIVQSDRFRPAQLRYISYDIKSNDFKLLLDKGDLKLSNSPNSSAPKLDDATQELFNYFLIGLALPNDTFWVNLRPDAPDNIIDPLLEKTDIGRIFLEADLCLKKDTAILTSPRNPEGRIYWDKLYKKAGELFGTENITIPTITRPWIVPNEVIVRETDDSAYIYKATLRVMLESDYLVGRGGSRTAPTSDQYVFSDPRLKELNEYSTQLIRETIIPKLTKEVNSGKRYARLRQVYYSLVLSRWFKQKYQRTVPGIDSGDLTNLALKEPFDKQAYFRDYRESFKEGEYNLRETIATPFGQSIRRYVSGGIMLDRHEPSGIKVNSSSPVTNILTGQPPASAALPLTDEQLEAIVSDAIEKVNWHGGPARKLIEVALSRSSEEDITYGELDTDQERLQKKIKLWLLYFMSAAEFLDKRIPYSDKISVSQDVVERFAAILQQQDRYRRTELAKNLYNSENKKDFFEKTLRDIYETVSRHLFARARQGKEKTNPDFAIDSTVLLVLSMLCSDISDREDNLRKHLEAWGNAALLEESKAEVLKLLERHELTKISKELNEAALRHFGFYKILKLEVESLTGSVSNAGSPLTDTSSIVETREVLPAPKRGGIDLTDRMLKINLERVGSFTLSSLALPEINNVEALDLGKEYERIQAMVSSSIRPSDTRILEFAAACYYRGEFDQRLTQVNSCIKAAHLADEISGRDSSEALRLATMLPDALYGG